MPNSTILVVEDDPEVREVVRFVLREADFTVSTAENALDAWEMIRKRPPDLILLDWMLPGISGIELVRQLRRQSNTRAIPVIILTAKGEEDDKLLGFESGADDYITKPFSSRELVARINAVLHRAKAHSGEAVAEFGEIRLDADTWRLTVAGEAVTLGPTEFRLLHFLVQNPERIHSRFQLLDRVWGTHAAVEERTIDVYMRRLRKALAHGRCDRYLQTVRGVGYRLSTEIGDEPASRTDS
uniref:Phosphate regulon transcriptional regulatory protein PhoB n=1 Tax=Candidatus Kentrum sp. DK TaxID=2126562 RepID=A0A450TB43_9GAMM|nr:MAG: two component transcriptional regulator, winged helix family [Candidatus Kentron sp. DK]VFJ63984.1 MAG: two component transcriptional regulator, winged helix family [Candidatus Kentron sp. DK]